MAVIISGKNENVLQAIINTMIFSGLEVGEIYSKKRYWFFGKVTYYAEVISMEINMPSKRTGFLFAPGGICHKDSGEFVIPRDNPMFLNSAVNARKAGEDLARIVKSLNHEVIPSQLKYLKMIEKEAVEKQDFEQAATIRDRIKSLKNQKK